MDITKQSFSNYLPWLLTDLASSCFVAIDFEFSGIALSSGSFGTNAQTLQQRYAEIKDAAEKHTILQIGLTICRETPEKRWFTYLFHLLRFMSRLIFRRNLHSQAIQY